ncbi:alpha-ketoglutarate-dependent dioxygenase AlkB family protein [Sporobolomyces salmoneus]|uniref:alpha-ketoglutarate-dependent dioxygenase AlkB family protein n=1 Tax=Sporobolomyces salmoneus TaxID=183962 RepID=UPI00316F044D
MTSSPTSPPSKPSPASSPAPKPTKRAPSTSAISKKPTKRARLTVGADETTQVSNLAQHRIPFGDAEVYYVEDFIDRDLGQKWHDELLEVEGWYQPTLKMYGKEITQSRKIAAFATDPNLTVKYSGALVDMKYEYPPLLRKIQDMVEEKLGVKFNHVMMNQYENGSVYIGNHRDNRENRVIASVSLGSPRIFIMEHDKPPSDAPASSKKPVKVTKSKTTPASAPPPPLPESKEEDPDHLLYYKKWTLENGSLVVMQGETQAKWKHQIPKEAKVRESRISLTFRQLVF